MAEVLFNREGIEQLIKCNEDTKMKNVLDEYSKQINIGQNKLYYIYKEKEVYDGLTFFDHVDDFDRFRKKMNIDVYEIKNIEEIGDRIGKTFKIDEMLSKNIICPECKENAFLNFKDFKFNFYGCKNNHNKKNITLFEYEKNQKLDTDKLKCSQCNKNKIKINEFYICNTCNNNICKECKLNHDINHIIINYKDKNYICKKHNKVYKKFCKTCKEDICILCNNEHNNHDIFDLGDILLNKNELFYSANKLEKLLKRFQFKVKMIKLILDKMEDMISNYYYIYLINIINYDMNKKNYSQLINLNYFYNKNEILIKDLAKIIEDDKVYEFSKENFYNEYGEKYVGETDKCLKNGKGLLYYNDENEIIERYEGDFKNNKKEGYGFIFWKNGNMCEGSFKNDKLDGKGIFNYIKGNKYIGEFKKGVKNGKGIYYYPNGNIYDGNWENGLKEGYGILFFCGNGYIGNWKNGKYDGKGTLFRDGNTIKGIWKDGEQIENKTEKTIKIGKKK